MRIRNLGLVGLSVLVGGLALPVTQVGAAQLRRPLLAAFGSFSNGTGIAVDQSNGNVFVADGGSSNQVDVFNAEGGSTPADGAPAKLTGAATPAQSFAFNGEPAGVAVDNSCFYQHLTAGACEASDSSDGAVYVTDVQHSVVDKFRLHNGVYEYVCQFRGYGFVGSACGSAATPSVASLGEPLGVTVDTHGNVYVANYSPAMIFEYNSAGEDIAQIPTPGGFPPMQVGIDSVGDLYVSAYGANSVYELTPKGPGEYNEPETPVASGGIAVDPTTDLFYADSGVALQEYSPQNKLLSEFGAGMFQYSSNVAENDTSKYLYAADNNNQIVLIGTPTIVAQASVEPASSVTGESATLRGTVNPEGQPVTVCVFEWSGGASLPCSPMPGAGVSPEAVSATTTGLTPNASYSYRIHVANANAPMTTEQVSFHTPAVVPVIAQAPSASRVTSTGVLLAGVVNPRNSQSTCVFLYGTTSAYGRTSVPQVCGSESGDEQVSRGLQGLQPGTTYHYALSVTNQAGTVTSADATFTTATATLPAISGVAVSAVGPGAATVSGTVATNGLPTTYELDFGADTSYATRASGQVVGSSQTVSLSLLFLRPGRTYHYRLVASNAEGTVASADQTFTTPAYQLDIPVVLPLIATPAVEFPAVSGANTSHPTKPKAKPKKRAGKRSKKSRRKGAGKRRK